MLSAGKDRRAARGGILTKLLLFLLMLAAIFALAWMTLLPWVLSEVVRSRTGFDVSIESLYANPFTATVHLKGLRVSNPSEFATRDFIDVRELSADAELTTLFSDKRVIDSAVVNVAKVTLVKNRAGLNNGTLFKQRLMGEKAGQEQQPVETKTQTAEAGSKAFLIKSLELRFDKLAMVDESGAQPSVRNVDVSFNQSYENVISPMQIAVPIVAKVLKLGGSLNDFAGRLGLDAMDAAKNNLDQLKELGRKAGDKIKGFFKSLKEKGGQ